MICERVTKVNSMSGVHFTGVRRIVVDDRAGVRYKRVSVDSVKRDVSPVDHSGGRVVS